MTPSHLPSPTGLVEVYVFVIVKKKNSCRGGVWDVPAHSSVSLVELPPSTIKRMAEKHFSLTAAALSRLSESTVQTNTRTTSPCCRGHRCPLLYDVHAEARPRFVPTIHSEINFFPSSRKTQTKKKRTEIHKDAPVRYLL